MVKDEMEQKKTKDRSLKTEKRERIDNEFKDSGFEKMKNIKVVLLVLEINNY